MTAVIDKVRFTPKESFSLLNLASKNMRISTIGELEEAFEGYTVRVVPVWGGYSEYEISPPTKGIKYHVLKEATK